MPGFPAALTPLLGGIKLASGKGRLRLTDANPAPGQPAPAIVRVPVWRVIGAGLRAVFFYPANLVRRTWPLTLVAAAALALRGARLGDFDRSGEETFGSALGMAAMTLAALGVAVHWHRGLLTGEPPAGAGILRPETAWLRFIGAVFLVVAGTMLTGSVLIAIMMGLLQLVADENIAFTLLWFLAAPIFIGMILIMGRLGAAYPMIALGGKTVASLRQSWRLTRGNTWRLFLLFIVYTVMEWVLFPAVLLISQQAENRLGIAGFALGILADAALVAVFTALLASLLSYVYAALTGHPAAAELNRRP